MDFLSDIKNYYYQFLTYKLNIKKLKDTQDASKNHK